MKLLTLTISVCKGSSNYVAEHSRKEAINKSILTIGYHQFPQGLALSAVKKENNEVLGKAYFFHIQQAECS